MKNHLRKLDQLLCDHAWLWREQPYKIARPAWCSRLPVLSDVLLQLADTDVIRFEKDQQALQEFMLPFVPSLEPLAALTTIPLGEQVSQALNEARFGWEVPGRKKQQIEAFSVKLTDTKQPYLEWCGGKGHLGRTLALLSGQPVETVEWNGQLCEQGQRLAKRAGVQQRFYQEDALDAKTLRHVPGKHVVALHACGDLHRQLVHAATQYRLTALDFSPCCYHLGRQEHYQAFNKELGLQLGRDDLRLSVTNSDTASVSRIKQRDQEMVWKLAFDSLRRQLQTNTPYQNIQPIPKAWLQLPFGRFCVTLAQREGVQLPDDVDWAHIESEGWRRQHEVMRLNLPRFAFRRAIEIWLVLDMAVHLQQIGYRVSVRRFCEPALTPRNLLVSVRPFDPL